MKRTAAVLLACLGAVALAQNVVSRTERYTSLTVVACSGIRDAGAGVSIEGASAYTVVTQADADDAGTQSLIGGGSMQCCYYGKISSSQPTTGSGSSSTSAWMRCPSALDVSMSAAANQRYYPSGDYEALTGVGRIAYVPSAVTIDGGTTVSTTITVRRAKP